ncbi:DUF4209 domain-containing protein [Labrys sp. KB_33_2]|uniref:DUF4209 domain-containing protein n=1 Tax=Labrys sp. KB_33_2 TaxID=3237479 RepID=UPI003F8E9712
MSDLVKLPNADLVQAVFERLGPVRDDILAAELRKEHEATPEAGWRLLWAVFSYLLRPNNVGQPFHPAAIMGGKRSPLPEDLTEAELEALRKLWEEMELPEFVGRVGDVLWLRKRDGKAAKRAVEAYFEAGKGSEDPVHWPHCMARYERALRLARQLSQEPLRVSILEHLQTRILHYDGKDPSNFSMRGLRLLAEFKYGDVLKLAEIAGRIATRAETSGAFERARGAYHIQAEFFRSAKDGASEEAAREALTETFIAEASAAEASNNWMKAHLALENAIAASRDRPGLKNKIPALQKRLAEAGRRTIESMDEFSHSTDITEHVRKTTAQFQGLMLDDALLTLAICVPLQDPAELRTVTLEQIEGAMHAHFDAVIYDAAGRKVAVRPAIDSPDEEDRERAIAGFIDQTARLNRDLSVHAVIAPALRVIANEHEITPVVVGPLLAGSPLIPDDRMPLFVKAIVAGAKGDFITALHLLIPQVENGLRHLIETQGGEVPRTMSPEGIEEVWGLEKCLDHPFILKCLGTDFVFELRSVLVARIGPNVRNCLAHGLLSLEALSDATAVYLWWLLFRLAAVPAPAMSAFVERHKTERAAESSATT